MSTLIQPSAIGDSFGSSTSTHRVRFDKLKKLRAALGRAAASQGRADIVFVGDSITAGSTTAVIPATESFCALLRSKLTAQGIPYGGDGWNWANNVNSTNETHWSVTGSWSAVVPLNGTSSNGATTTFTSTNAGTVLKFGIYSNGSATYSLDGGGEVAVPTTAGTTRVTTITGLANTTHSIRFTSTGTSPTFYVAGACVETDGTNGAFIHNLGGGGTTTGAWTVGANYSGDNVGTTIVPAPHCVFIMLGTNDARNSVATATYTANLATIIAAWQAVGADVVLMVPPQPKITEVATATWVTYQAAAQSAALTADIPVVDFSDLLGLWTEASGYGLYTDRAANIDSLHPGPAGHAAICHAIGQAFALEETIDTNVFSTGQRVSGSAVSLTTATATNVTSVSLTAGDWDVWGVVDYVTTGATTSDFKSGISTTSATFGAQDTFQNMPFIATALSDTFGHSVSPTRVSLSATTTVYLLGQSNFSVGTATAYGSIYARRRR